MAKKVREFHEFPTKIKAYLEANEEYAKEMFAIAKSHRMIYMTMNEKAMGLFRPVIEFFEKEEAYDEAIEYLYKNVPDCLERTLVITRLIDLSEGKNPKIKI